MEKIMKIKLILISLITLTYAPTVVAAEQITITVKGMVCSFCAQGIKKTLGEINEVENIEVDLDKKLVQIKTKKGTTLADDVIKNAITDSGYEIFSIERSSDE